MDSDSDPRSPRDPSAPHDPHDPRDQPEPPRRGRADVTTLRTDAAIETRRLAASLGSEARATRRRHRQTQARIAGSAGISRARYAELERGDGAMAPLDSWVRVGLALARPLAVGLSRDIQPASPADSGHLAAQEWLIARALEQHRDPSFELPTRPAPDAPVADLCLRDAPQRTLAFIEIWNRLDDLGAATRSSDRKALDAHALAAIAAGPAIAASPSAGFTADPSADPERPYRVAVGWVLVDTAANRRLVAAYPAILRARFPGSSVELVRALSHGEAFPDEPAIAWFDPRIPALRPLRLRG